MPVTVIVVADAGTAFDAFVIVVVSLAMQLKVDVDAYPGMVTVAVPAVSATVPLWIVGNAPDGNAVVDPVVAHVAVVPQNCPCKCRYTEVDDLEKHCETLLAQVFPPLSSIVSAPVP